MTMRLTTRKLRMPSAVVYKTWKRNRRRKNNRTPQMALVARHSKWLIALSSQWWRKSTIWPPWGRKESTRKVSKATIQLTSRRSNRRPRWSSWLQSSSKHSCHTCVMSPILAWPKKLMKWPILKQWSRSKPKVRARVRKRQWRSLSRSKSNA